MDMEHDNHHCEDKDDMYEKILRSRLSSTSSDSGIGCGSPPCSENKLMEGYIHKLHTTQEEAMKFANPVEAIPMPWKSIPMPWK